MSDKPLPLRPGEYVTLIFLPLEGHMHVAQAVVVTSTLTKFSVPYGVAQWSGNRSASYSLDEEGVMWLRGLYSLGSPEVDAAITAQALELKNKPQS